MTITLEIVGITFLLIYYFEVFSQATKVVGLENGIILMSVHFQLLYQIHQKIMEIYHKETHSLVGIKSAQMQ